MSRRSNFNDKPAATHRFDNFERRLKETMGTDQSAEMVTPNTAGQEELTPYEDVFPLVKNQNQTNMRSGGRRVRDGQLQAGRENE
jgi:hypothetical protein